MDSVANLSAVKVGEAAIVLPRRRGTAKITAGVHNAAADLIDFVTRLVTFTAPHGRLSTQNCLFDRRHWWWYRRTERRMAGDPSESRASRRDL
jgi:hypothetical protein